MNLSITKIYEQAVLLDHHIVLDGQVTPVIKGKHALWLPELGIKLVWMFNGKLESFRNWRNGRNCEAIATHHFNENCPTFNQTTLESLANELAIFDALSQVQMAPPVNGLVYVRSIITTDFFGALHCDPRGVLGYYIENAHKLPTGEFTFDKFQEAFLATGKIKASIGALGDIKKSNNVVNGYLIDIRRTIWDMIQWTGRMPKITFVGNSKQNVMDKVATLGQFPYKERKKPYQSYYLDSDGYIDGSRDTVGRFKAMGLPEDMAGQSVLDLGCCLGAMAAEAYRRGARWVTGIDGVPQYIDCAREVARYNGYQINYLHMDLADCSTVINFANKYYPDGASVVFALALYKHIKDHLWTILRNIKWTICYMESHNAPQGLDTGHVREMVAYMGGVPEWKVQYLGQVTDRSPRCIWRIDR